MSMTKSKILQMNQDMTIQLREKSLYIRYILYCFIHRWIDCLLNAVDPSLPDGLSLSLLHMMETKLLDLAKKRGYHGIVTVNSHPVTMVIYYTHLKKKNT